MGVLDGIRVLDFGRYIAGPFCGALLGDLGADVIRVERVDGGEDRFVTPVTDDGIGAMFLQCNRNKRCLTLNPVKAEGREVVRRLVATADVVVANLPPGPRWTRWASTTTRSRAIKPDIILTTVNAWASGGAWSHKVGFDGLAQSASGNLHLTGPEDQPGRAFVPYVDFGTASLSAMSTVAAIAPPRPDRRGPVHRGRPAADGADLQQRPPSSSSSCCAIDRVGSHEPQPDRPARPTCTAPRTAGSWCLVIGSLPVRALVPRWSGRPELAARRPLQGRRGPGEQRRGPLGLHGRRGAPSAPPPRRSTRWRRHKVPGGPVLLAPAGARLTPHQRRSASSSPSSTRPSSQPVPPRRLPGP